MSKSSELLRERAVQCAVDEASGDAAVIAAVAELMEATERYIAWTEGEGEGYSGHDLLQRLRYAHAALKRAIGESDAST